ncbi:MAG TPA: DNA-directed RNA polymerase subunit omega [Syntrophales bacterium]|nr:DNA-directed RNA polymerase subunit omega [Syntrophales bacterium]
MARVTVEDALKEARNRFALVILSGQRTRQLLKGSQPLVDNRDNKQVVTSLREIAAGKVKYSHPELLDKVEEQAKQIGDDMGFMGDEEDSE